MCKLNVAQFDGADLVGAEVTHSSFRYANFSGANLSRARFSNCDFTRAKFDGAVLHRTAFVDCQIEYSQLNLPPASQGDVLGYKKCQGNKVVTLRIPEAASRHVTMFRGPKYRAEYAEVVQISDGSDVAYDLDDLDFAYHVGGLVFDPKGFQPDWRVTGGGISLFQSYQEAEQA